MEFWKQSICRFGGIGGKGGDVIAVATPSITLETVFRQNKYKTYKAQNGNHSTPNFIVGVPGEDLKIPVPVGVTMITELGRKIGIYFLSIVIYYLTKSTYILGNNYQNY